MFCMYIYILAIYVFMNVDGGCVRMRELERRVDIENLSVHTIMGYQESGMESERLWICVRVILYVGY